MWVMCPTQVQNRDFFVDLHNHYGTQVMIEKLD